MVSYTAAHELGHLLLHDEIELHRDIPLDGSENLKGRSAVEREADKFAAYFLMPGKTVTQAFHELFQTEQFQINEMTSQMLANCSTSELRKKVKNQRDLSRLIAKCEFYNFKAFISMAKIFNVSIEAMAIQLEELKLIRF